MNRIIALYGHAQCGKSSTLNYLRQMLRKSGTTITAESNNYWDRREVISYKSQVVALCPGGDNEGVIEKNIEYAEEHNADILITASRVRGNGPKRITDYSDANGIVLQWVRKSYEFELSDQIQEDCNQAVAEIILNKI